LRASTPPGELEVMGRGTEEIFLRVSGGPGLTLASAAPVRLVNEDPEAPLLNGAGEEPSGEPTDIGLFPVPVPAIVPALVPALVDDIFAGLASLESSAGLGTSASGLPILFALGLIGGFPEASKDCDAILLIPPLKLPLIPPLKLPLIPPLASPTGGFTGGLETVFSSMPARVEAMEVTPETGEVSDAPGSSSKSKVNILAIPLTLVGVDEGGRDLIPLSLSAVSGVLDPRDALGLGDTIGESGQSELPWRLMLPRVPRVRLVRGDLVRDALRCAWAVKLGERCTEAPPPAPPPPPPPLPPGLASPALNDMLLIELVALEELTWLAKRIVHSDSPYESSVGLRWTIC
jgi:hypothetical protein